MDKLLQPISSGTACLTLGACLLMGSCAPPGMVKSAEKPSGFGIVKYNNPEARSYLGVGLWAWPLPMDYDGDGDMDLLVSCPDKPFNGLHFFENVSGSAFPEFAPPVRLAPSLKDVQVSYVDGEPRVLLPGAELVDFRDSLDSRKKPLYPVDSILKDFKKKPRFN
ncbi:MAG TPA: hypothetical protein VD772_00190, partial [Anseongella sp.]|nr:hypothetical protein [Anseongella sp.]